MVRNLDIPFGDTLQESTLATSVLTQQTVSLAIVQTDLGTFNQQSAVEGQAVLINLDISTLGVRNQDTIGGSVRSRRKLGHLRGSRVGEVLGGSVGGEVGHGRAGGGDVGGRHGARGALCGGLGGLLVQESATTFLANRIALTFSANRFCFDAEGAMMCVVVR